MSDPQASNPQSAGLGAAGLECEFIERTAFTDPSEAQRKLFSYIEGFYNSSRRHSSIDYKSPMTYELEQTKRTTQPAIA